LQKKNIFLTRKLLVRKGHNNNNNVNFFKEFYFVVSNSGTVLKSNPQLI